MAGILRRLKDRFSRKQKRRLYPLHIFRELEESLNLIEDLDQISLNILGKIKETVPAASQVFFIYDQDVGEFKVCAQLGFEEHQLRNASFSRNDRLAGWLKINKTPLNRRQNPGAFAFLGEKERGVIGALGLEVFFPLISMNRLVGILAIGGKKEGGASYTKQEVSFIELLTPQIGIALENAVLYKEQRDRFRRMLRADRLATIGELAAGAAHEIRNPLTAIRSSLQYLETRSHDDREKKLLLTSLQETERIDEILSALLSFSKPAEIKKETHNLLETLDETLDLVSFQTKTKKVGVLKKFPAAPVFISGDRSQLKQLFLNLLLNSIQAMDGGGEIEVEVTGFNERQVLVAVSDTGSGIPDEHLEKIFDPFFTTKKGGTGLGLSICYSIVKSHKGDIEVKSRPGEGTKVLVKLPLS